MEFTYVAGIPRRIQRVSIFTNSLFCLSTIALTNTPSSLATYIDKKVLTTRKAEWRASTANSFDFKDGMTTLISFHSRSKNARSTATLRLPTKSGCELFSCLCRGGRDGKVDRRLLQLKDDEDRIQNAYVSRRFEREECLLDSEQDYSSCGSREESPSFSDHCGL